MSRLSIALLILATSLCSAADTEKAPVDPSLVRGHMMPIGSNSELLDVEVRDVLPGPTEFYNNYVRPSRPVLFRGLAKRFASFENMKSDAYLK